MSDEWVSGKVKLNLAGEPLELEMTVPANPVKVRRMLPVFQAVADAFVEIGEAAAEQKNEQISCQKGCAACCYQVVPLMQVETYHLKDLIEALPEPRRSSVLNRFNEAIEKLLAKDWFNRAKKYDEMTYAERIEISMEYFYQKIPCPFLEDNVCSIYESRPLACREYLVTSPAENCENPSPFTIRPLKIPAKPFASMRQFNQTERFVPLVAALAFAEQTEESKEIKAGPEWMQMFFKKMSEDSKES